MLDVSKATKTEKELVEACLPSYLLYVAVSNLHKDKSNKYISLGYIDLLQNAALAPLHGVGARKIKKVWDRLKSITDNVLKEANVLDTYTELVLSVSRLNLDLLQKCPLVDPNSQGILIATSITEEAATYGDFGSLKAAKGAAGKMETAIFKEGLFNGSNSKH